MEESFKRYADGATMKEIVEYLTEHGVKNTYGNPLNYNSVQRMLKNRRYIGEYSFMDVVIPDGMPAIVTKDEWEAAQAAIRSISKRALPQKTNFPLTSKVRCGNCGCSMPYDDHGTPSLCCLHRQGVGKHSKCDSTACTGRA